MGLHLGTHLEAVLGTELGEDLAPRFPWSGFENNLVLALDAHLGIQTETGVSTWSDQSSQANHVSQADTGKQPALSSFGGRPAIDFDGVDDFLRTASFSGISGQDSTVFVVAKFDVASGNFGLTDLSDIATSTNRYQNFFHNGNQLYFRNYGTRTTNYTYTDTTNAHVVEGVNENSGQAELLEDGVSQDTDATANTSPVPTILVVGDAEDGSHKMNGVIQSVLIFNTNMSAADRSTIRGRLGLRWGISVTT